MTIKKSKKKTPTKQIASNRRNAKKTPKIHIDQEKFEKLCAIQCTLVSIAAVMDVSEDTIERWCKRTYKLGFAEVFRQKREPGKIALRQKMFQIAMDGSVAMQIFLAKNWLAMSDKPEAVDEDGAYRIKTESQYTSSVDMTAEVLKILDDCGALKS